MRERFNYPQLVSVAGRQIWQLRGYCMEVPLHVYRSHLRMVVRVVWMDTNKPSCMLAPSREWR